MLGGNEVHLLEGSQEKHEAQALEASLRKHLAHPKGANFVNDSAGGESLRILFLFD